jgi:TolB protein
MTITVHAWWAVESRRAPWGRRQTVKTVRLDHLRATLLAVAAGGLLAAVGLLVALYAQPAEANYPGTPGKIAYAGWDQNKNDTEIYTVNPDGGSNVKVTNDQSTNRWPAYSPSGKKIAYSGLDQGDWDIYTINTDGGSKKNVTNTNSTDDYQPDYAPGGTNIAYAGNDGQDWDIYTINTNGGSKKNVTNSTADDYYPSYSPSGKNIAYVYDPGTGDTEIYYIKPDGGGKIRVTDNKTENQDPYWGCKGGCKR